MSKGVQASNQPRFGVKIIENLSQEVPVDSSVQTVLQKHTLVAITGWDHAAVHEIELDELCVGQVQVNRHQLTGATLERHTETISVTHIQNLIDHKITLYDQNTNTNVIVLI